MWNPFKKKTTITLSEATNMEPVLSINLQLLIAVEDMLKGFDTEVPSVPIKQVLPVPKEVETLISAGFTSHRKVQAFKEKQEALDAAFLSEFSIYKAASNRRQAVKEALDTLLKARRVYGPNTLLMPLDKFMSICKKHNLICGTFNDYTGDIPYDKLQEIVQLRKKGRIIEHNSAFKVDKVIKTGDGQNSTREYKVFHRHFDNDFPILRSCSGPYVFGLEFLDSFVGSFCHMRFEGASSYYFIAAPKEMMTGDVQEVYDPKKDPIIWGLAGNNVLIFTRWGEEASDEEIQRFEAFNQKLDAFAESLK